MNRRGFLGALLAAPVAAAAVVAVARRSESHDEAWLDPAFVSRRDGVALNCIPHPGADHPGDPPEPVLSEAALEDVCDEIIRAGNALDRMHTSTEWYLPVHPSNLRYFHRVRVLR